MRECTFHNEHEVWAYPWIICMVIQLSIAKEALNNQVDKVLDPVDINQPFLGATLVFV